MKTCKMFLVLASITVSSGMSAKIPKSLYSKASLRTCDSLEGRTTWIHPHPTPPPITVCLCFSLVFGIVNLINNAHDKPFVNSRWHGGCFCTPPALSFFRGCRKTAALRAILCAFFWCKRLSRVRLRSNDVIPEVMLGPRQ